MDTKLVVTQDDYDRFVADYASADVVVVDTETNGLDVWTRDHMVGLAAYLPEQEQAYYIPTQHGVGRFIPRVKKPSAKMRNGLPHSARAYEVYKAEHPLTNFFDPALKKLARYWDRPPMMIMHNAAFDLAVLERAGFPRPKAIRDTQVAAHLILSSWHLGQFPMPNGEKEQGNKRLKWLARYLRLDGATRGEEALDAAIDRLNAALMEIDPDIYKLSKKEYLWALPSELVATYAGHDVYLTWQLHEKLSTILEKWNLTNTYGVYGDIQLKATHPAAVNGFTFDREEAERMLQFEQEDRDRVLAKIKAAGYGDVNPSSPKQIKAAVLTRDGIILPSTDKKAVKDYGDRVPLLPLIVEYRGVKIAADYLRRWKALPDDIVRANVRLDGTATYRTSSGSGEYGNLQNIPANTDVVVSPKKLLRPPSDQYHIVELDYKSLEMMVMAFVAEGAQGLNHPDKTLTRMMQEGIDMHAYTRDHNNFTGILLDTYRGDVEAFLQDRNHPTDGHSPEEIQETFLKVARQLAKLTNFACAYGSRGRSLSTSLNVPLQVGYSLAEAWRLSYPSVASAMDEYEKLAKKWRPAPNGAGRHQYVSYPFFNVVRRYDHIPTSAPTKTGGWYNPREAEQRKAFNSVVQGSGGIITIVSMLRIAQWLEQEGAYSYLIGTVHDSILMAVHKDELEAVIPAAQGLMERWLITPRLQAEAEVAPAGMAWGYKEEWQG